MHINGYSFSHPISGKKIVVSDIKHSAWPSILSQEGFCGMWLLHMNGLTSLLVFSVSIVIICFSVQANRYTFKWYYQLSEQSW